MLRDHSWWDSGIPEVEPESTACKASVLPTVPPLQLRHRGLWVGYRDAENPECGTLALSEPGGGACGAGEDVLERRGMWDPAGDKGRPEADPPSLELNCRVEGVSDITPGFPTAPLVHAPTTFLVFQDLLGETGVGESDQDSGAPEESSGTRPSHTHIKENLWAPGSVPRPSRSSAVPPAASALCSPLQQGSTPMSSSHIPYWLSRISASGPQRRAFQRAVR